MGELGINTPDLVNAKERGIPNVLKNVVDPLFKKSVIEPLSLNDIVIKGEIRLEDAANDLVLNNNKSVKNTFNNKGKSKMFMSNRPVRVGESTSSCTSGLGNANMNNCNDMPNMHTMPMNSANHKSCGILNCVKCAFKVMSTYFFNKHATSNSSTPRNFMNKKKHVRSWTVSPPSPSSRTSSSPKGPSPSSRTSSPTKGSVETWTPKLKPKVVKAVYKVKCPVPVDDVVVKIKNVVLPDKG